MTKKLPRYSGRTGSCPKCGDADPKKATWVERIERSVLADEWDELSKKQHCWYALYVNAGRDCFLLPLADELTTTAWYPAEWLHRECKTCDYHWDEACLEPEDEAPASASAKTAKDHLGVSVDFLRAFAPLLKAVATGHDGEPIYASEDYRKVADQLLGATRHAFGWDV